jgi:hypothetical protein
LRVNKIIIRALIIIIIIEKIYTRRQTPRMMMQPSTTTTTPGRRPACPSAKNTTARKPKTTQRDPTNTEDSLLSDSISDKLLRLTKPFQWGGRSATPLADDGCIPSQQSSCSHRHRNCAVIHRHPTHMEQHHAKYGVVIHEFMKVSLVFNLFQGSPEDPVDERYIGPKCKLPIIRHRLQRLFNRKLVDTMVQYDIYRPLDPCIGVHGNTTTQPSAIKRAWDEGFYDPVNRDIPLLLRHRILPTNIGRLKKMVSRFGTTIPARPYPYSQQLTMNSYAYSMQFSNCLVGTITIPGAPSLAPPAEGAAPVTCPFGCKHGDINGGKHAVTCKKLGRHVQYHALVEDAVALMIMDALAIHIKQNRAAVVLSDEKRDNAGKNLCTTIPIIPHVDNRDGPNTNGRIFGAILVVQNAILPATRFPTNNDHAVVNGPSARAMVERHANMSKL